MSKLQDPGGKPANIPTRGRPFGQPDGPEAGAGVAAAVHVSWELAVAWERAARFETGPAPGTRDTLAAARF